MCAGLGFWACSRCMGVFSYRGSCDAPRGSPLLSLHRVFGRSGGRPFAHRRHGPHVQRLTSIMTSSRCHWEYLLRDLCGSGLAPIAWWFDPGVDALSRPPLRSRTWRWWRTCTYTLSQSRLFTWPVFAWGSCTPAIPPPGVAWHAAWVSALWFRPTHNTFGFCTFLFILICFLHLPHFQVCFCSPILTYRSAHLIHITPITLHIPSFSSIFHTCWHIGLTFLHHIFYHFFIISLTHTLPVFTHLHHLTSHTFSFLLSDVLICSYFQASTYIHGDNLRHHTTTPSCPCTVTPPQLPWCGLCLQFTCLARPLSLPLPGLVSVFG